MKANKIITLVLIFCLFSLIFESEKRIKDYLTTAEIELKQHGLIENMFDSVLLKEKPQSLLAAQTAP